MLTCPSCQQYTGVPLGVQDAVSEVRVLFHCTHCAQEWTALYTLLKVEELRQRRLPQEHVCPSSQV